MARINLTVPDDLKDQMDARGGINWSRVASEAFSRVIHKATEFDMTDMTKVADRLRLDIQTEAAGYEGGGRKWAAKEATARELQILEKADDLVEAMNLIAHRCYKSSGEHFWDDIEVEPSDAAKQKFGEGALDVWLKVKSHL